MDTLLDALLLLQTDRLDTTGICLQLPIRHREPFLDLATRWPEYSGIRDFPVPSVTDRSPKVAYGVLPLWSGPYGEARLRLLDWAIKELQRAT